MAYAAKPTNIPAVIKSKAEAYKSDAENAIKTPSDEVRFWLGQITTSKAEAEKLWWVSCRDAWREYQGEKPNNKARKFEAYTANNYQRYWSDTMVMLPALYSNSPTVVARRRFNQDPVSKTASIIIERLAKYLIASHDFDATMKTAALEFLNTNKATCRVYYRCELIKRPVRVMLQEVPVADKEDAADAASEQGQSEQQEQPQTTLVDKNMNPPPPGAVIDTDQDGQPYYEMEGEEEEVQNPQVYTEALHFDERLISPGARRAKDVWWSGIKITITRKDAVERFGEEKVNKIKPASDANKTDEVKESKDLFSYWEIWNLRDKKTLFLNEMLKDEFLDEVSDPYGLMGFYPMPTDMITNERYTDLYPSTDYSLTQDLYENLHLLVQRKNILLKSIKGAALFDNSILGLEDFLNGTGDGQAVGLGNFKDLMSNGGLQNALMFPDYSELASTLAQVNQEFISCKSDLDEIRGISDIIRGTSDPVTSATAERIKKQAATNKFSLRQHDMERFVRDTIEMMVDLALKEGATPDEDLFPDECLKEIVGYQYLDVEDQNRWGQALELLRDDKSRLVRIDIETASIITLNEEDNKNQATEMMSAISSFMLQTTQAIQQTPQVAPLMFKLLSNCLFMYPQGKSAEDELTQVFDDLNKMMSAPPAPPAPPPPDPKLLEIQSNERIEMAKLNALQQKNVAEFQEKQRQDAFDNQIENFKAQLEQQANTLSAQIENQKLIIAEQKMNFDAQLQSRDLDVKQGIAANQAAVKNFENMLAQQQEAFRQQFSSLQLQLEQQSFQQSIAEKQAEEYRLQQQMIMDASKESFRESMPQAAPQLPPIHINNYPAPATQKVASIIRDPITGNAQIIQHEVPSDPMAATTYPSETGGSFGQNVAAPLVNPLDQALGRVERGVEISRLSNALKPKF